MEYGLIGAKLGHSYSVPIHARLGGYDYRLYEMTEDEARAHLAARDFKGLNVTIPYKKLALEYCDVLSDAARAIGSVNTLLVRPDGSLYGDNTDIGGFLSMAARAGVTLADRKVIILGSGGTSLTARAACRLQGAREIVVISRQGPVDYDALYRDHADAQVLVNTTPVGMYPNNGASPADLSRLPHLEGVLDVIYNPDRTALILDAEARGLPCAGGLYMLVDQARRAAEVFTGKAIAPAATDDIFAELRAEALNLVLIGMPGSGKSSVGRALAEALDRPFVDCDAEIARRAGMSIPEIFETRGEAAFRDLEAQVLADVCREKGRVVASGGGAVLREDNVRAMRQNGRLILLERALDALSMDGRPLSKSLAALEAMWALRAPKYHGAMDARVDNNGDFEQTVARAKEVFYEAARH